MENCKPTICNKTDLMREDFVFMTKELIREDCAKCLHKSLCLQAIDLLGNGKHELALNLLENKNV